MIARQTNVIQLENTMSTEKQANMPRNEIPVSTNHCSWKKSLFISRPVGSVDSNHCRFNFVLLELCVRSQSSHSMELHVLYSLIL